MEKHEAAALLTRTITSVLSEFPELAGDASAAIGAGVSAAAYRLREERGTAQLAMVTALALLPPNRINAQMQTALEHVVLKAINESNMCPAEAKFVARLDADQSKT